MASDRPPLLRRLFSPASRPFVFEFELVVALAYLLMAAVALFLEYRLIFADRDLRQALQRNDEARARLVAERIAAGVVAERIRLEPGPSGPWSTSEELARMAKTADLDRLELRSERAPELVLTSSRWLGNELADAPPSDLPASRAVRGAANETWYRLAEEGYPDLLIRLVETGAANTGGSADVRAIVIAVPVILLVCGGVLVWLLIRFGRRIDGLVRGAVESGLVETGSPIRDETQLVEGALRRTVVELRRREAELQALLDRERDRAAELQHVSNALRRQMPGAVVTVDGAGVLRDFNARAADWFGLAEAALGQPSRIALAAHPTFAELLTRALAGQDTLVQDEIEIDAEPSRVLAITVVPVVAKDARFLGVMAVAQDVTAVRELERRLRLRETMASLGDVSAGLAHELRNSVAAALGFCRLAQADVERSDPPSAERQIGRIRDELKSLEGSVQDFLDFAREPPFERSPVDLAMIIDEAVAEARLRFPDVAIEWTPQPATVSGERTRLRHILWNLLTNAGQELAEARPAQPRISVRLVSRRAQRIELIVEDNGRGVPEDLAPRVFLPFVSGKDRGSGLGLSLVQKFALALEGEVRLESSAGGARFVVDLPLVSET